MVKLEYGVACSKAGDGPLQGLWESSILFSSTNKANSINMNTYSCKYKK